MATLQRQNRTKIDPDYYNISSRDGYSNTWAYNESVMDPDWWQVVNGFMMNKSQMRRQKLLKKKRKELEEAFISPTEGYSFNL